MGERESGQKYFSYDVLRICPEAPILSCRRQLCRRKTFSSKTRKFRYISWCVHSRLSRSDGARGQLKRAPRLFPSALLEVGRQRSEKLHHAPLLHTPLSVRSPPPPRFGSQRLWGAVGFGIASLLAGYVCDLYGGSYSGVMLVFVGNVLVALVASTGVPVGQVNNGDQDEGASRG